MTRIKQLREAAGMKQYELAARAGVKGSSVFKWEHGMSFPTAENLMVLADIFGVSTDYILGREPVQDGQNTA
ncbi:helix-turn-helix domain-containing protein [uncultured Dysosmobacter sp.]|uniref:helix-turn-helix domain-containing protein n=1 Tax=uncultured Dysosmobacter sp. TaxID=2591384 RepID=UPI002614FBBD|nr:helix-turn-helix transcriptional regulator [uncultured Dysosmobacter sp.]